jgi:3-methyladenine DNA glycosylase/8-oxoguanine DNA glycosylase
VTLTLVRSIVYQQLAGVAARAIHGRLIAALNDDVSPEQVLPASTDALRAAGLSQRKVESLRDLAAKVLDGTVVLDPRRLGRLECDLPHRGPANEVRIALPQLPPRKGAIRACSRVSAVL